MVKSVVVLGAGSAGLLAALTLKRKLPALEIEVIYSSKLGIIGVGEGTTPYVPSHIHGYLGLPEDEVFKAVNPVFKLGVRFQWGRRDFFDYTFSGRQYDWRWPQLPRNNGFYTDEDASAIDLPSALMEAGRALPRRTDGLPDVPPPGMMAAWHLENHGFAEWLEKSCRAAGVRFTDTEFEGADLTPEGDLECVRLADGSSRSADLFVDCSGFRSALLGEVLREPFVDFSNALFCDRAVAGGWDRGEEPILPYTVSETMENGWCWRIDHPQRIHRGYVFSSDHLSDEAAIEEFRKTAPKVAEPRIVKFRSGCYERAWVGNVVAVGNASGFVEPLEATALMMICLQSRWLADGLIDSECRPTRSMRKLYNKMHGSSWTDIRDFLALHYRFNDRLENPFWRRCREETPLGTLTELVEFYRENGPSAIAKVLIPGISNIFGLEGYFAILCGLRAPHQRPHAATAAEQVFWEARRKHFRGLAQEAFTMEEVGDRLRDGKVWRAIRARP